MDENPADFFRVERFPARQRPQGDFNAWATIRRRDSDEPVARVLIRRRPSAEDAQQRVEQEVVRRLGALEKPADWGKSPMITRLIERYVAMRRRTYSAPGKKTATPIADAPRLRKPSDHEQAEELASLGRDVNALDDQKKVDLIAPNAYQIANPIDAWVLDELSAKKRLFELIKAPSPQVHGAFRALDALLNPEGETFPGWPGDHPGHRQPWDE